jgi:predicted  nucleic acid-binding Zn-ribbon protein
MERVARLEALVEEFRKTREELRKDIRRLWDRIEEVRAELKEDIRQLREEIRELRTYVVGGFIVVVAVSVLLKLLG